MIPVCLESSVGTYISFNPFIQRLIFGLKKKTEFHRTVRNYSRSYYCLNWWLGPYKGGLSLNGENRGFAQS